MNTPKLSSEMRLLLACARRPSAAFHAEGVVEARRQPLDWRRFLKLVDRHCVAPLIWHSLRAAKVKPPTDAQSALKQRLEQNTRRALLLTAELVRLGRLFEAAGIRMLSLKGPGLAIQVYGDLALRHAGDLDLLIDPAAIQDAGRVLGEAGYRLSYPRFSLTSTQAATFTKRMHHFGYTHKEYSVYLELHWRWTANAHLFPLAIDEAWQRRESLLVSGTPIPTLGREDLLLYLCTHGALHIWSRLQWLCDIAELLKQDRVIDLDQLGTRARRLGVQRMLAQGLSVAHRVLDASPPPALLESVTPDPRTLKALTDLALHTLLQDSHYPARAASVSLKFRRLAYALRLRSEPGYKGRELYGYLVNPEDWQSIHLPDRLFHLYFGLRPLLWLGKRVRQRFRA